MKAILICSALALGGCSAATQTQIDASIANADARLREQCLLLQGASILAITIRDDEIVRTISDALSLYCTSARVDNAVTATQRAAEIYKLVSDRMRKH